LRYASGELQKDHNFIEGVIKEKPELATNLKFILEAARQNSLVLHFAEENTREKVKYKLSEEKTIAKLLSTETQLIQPSASIKPYLLTQHVVQQL